MGKHAPIAPFDICIPSAVNPPDWETDKGNGGKPAGERVRRIMPRVLTIAIVALIAWGLTHMPNSGVNLLLSPVDTRKQTQTEKDKDIPWKQSGKDFGMVLLDISTRQAALAFHVPVAGVYVLAVARQSPADLSGVQPGDHITGLNGEAVSSSQKLTEALGKLADGDTAELTVLRGLNKVTLTLVMESDLKQL